MGGLAGGAGCSCRFAATAAWLGAARACCTARGRVLHDVMPCTWLHDEWDGNRQLGGMHMHAQTGRRCC
jgi:hypothetical protein